METTQRSAARSGFCNIGVNEVVALEQEPRIVRLGDVSTKITRYLPSDRYRGTIEIVKRPILKRLGSDLAQPTGADHEALCDRASC